MTTPGFTRRGAHDETVAVRMAMEGIPIASIGRVLRWSPALVRVVLGQALASGVLKLSPPVEWDPPSLPRRATSLRFEVDPAEVGKLTMRLVVAPLGLHRQHAIAAAVLALAPVADEDTIAQYAVSHAIDPRASKVIDVLICKLRPRLAAIDVSVETVWGVGYRLTEENRSRLLIWLEKQGV